VQRELAVLKALRSRLPLLLLFTLGAPGVWSQQDRAEPARTNLEVAQGLARGLARDAGDVFHPGDSGSVSLTLRPNESSWYIHDAVRQGIADRGRQVVARGGSAYSVEFGLRTLRVEYVNPSRDGLFSPRVVDRKVTVELSARIVDERTGELLGPSEMSGSSVDTVDVGDIGTLENPNLPLTKGEPPDEAFFANAVEPLVIIGAVAVAVYLLFHVRS
jgi:hypothetical protein